MIDEPCGWTTLGCEECDVLESVDETTRQAIEAAAIEYVWRWSGRAYGLCPVTIRPCRDDCGSSTWNSASSSAPFRPVLIGGDWHNLACGICGHACSCTQLCEVTLPGPIHEVTEIKVDGAVVDPTTYRVDNWTKLVRVGAECWPTCQDMNLPDTDEGTFSIAYNIGQPVPPQGKLAAGVLTCELAKAVCGDDSCQLSGRVQEVTREGVTMILMPPDLERGETGIWAIDSFIKSQAAPRNARIVNPDLWLRQRRGTS